MHSMFALGNREAILQVKMFFIFPRLDLNLPKLFFKIEVIFLLFLVTFLALVGESKGC